YRKRLDWAVTRGVPFLAKWAGRNVSEYQPFRRPFLAGHCEGDFITDKIATAASFAPSISKEDWRGFRSPQLSCSYIPKSWSRTFVSVATKPSPNSLARQALM